MVNAVMDALRERLTQLEKLVGADKSDEEVTLVDLLDAVLNSIDSHKLAHEAHVPKPKAFGGARNAKELENFLWDMEQYFLAAHVPEGEKVTITAMYLTGDAKLWWNTRLEDENWAQLELRRLGVKDLSSAVAAVDNLANFKLTRPRRARDCPKHEKLNAICLDEKKGGDPDSDNHVHVNSLQLLNMIHAAKASPLQRSGLMCIKVMLCNTDVLAMVDTGATHNFVSEGLAQSLGFKVIESSNRIKIVNSTSQFVHGTTSNISLKVGNWNGRVDLMVYPLDDFELILGNEFFLAAKVAVMPHLSGILIADGKQPYFVSQHSKDKRIREGTGGWLSVIQVQKGLKKGEATYLAALVEIKPDVQAEVSDKVAGLLKEFSDVMPDEFPKPLPLRGATDHKIELVPSAWTGVPKQSRRLSTVIFSKLWTARLGSYVYVLADSG
ncbi:hypothetical protein Vadar_003409 [Vaccinium darrowii]|uniref:Uncharacterized protein n=1 Tax=Vaccinium darrowii TaxID=229202 RepID=A0ACB7X7E0_9ERIC|nr:hypothetical protein Vadar_003409 [Vaccinium darrowii]